MHVQLGSTLETSVSLIRWHVTNLLPRKSFVLGLLTTACRADARRVGPYY